MMKRSEGARTQLARNVAALGAIVVFTIPALAQINSLTRE